MKNSTKSICGAKNRQGQPCAKPPLKGKTRCKLHGGATPKGRQTGPMTHGLYSNALTEAEVAAWGAVPLGDVDHEIRMCKIWLARAMVLDHTISQPPAVDGTELAEIRRSSSSDDGMNRTDTVSRRPDTTARINMLVGRIAQLEKTRAELIAAAQASGDDDKARDLVETLKAMKRTEMTPSQ